MNSIQRLRRDESGMSYVFVGFSMMAFISASMLAIDVGMLMTARSQAQNAADAGALAGATALIYDNWDDRSPTGPAVTNAVNASLQNKVMSGNVSVGPADVEFSSRSRWRTEPRQGHRVSQRRAWKSVEHDDCEVLWHRDRGHRRDRDCRSC
jgi:Flp pilus assembly protein TadG